MQTLIPCTSRSGRSSHESILVNPNELQSWYGFSGPYQIAKTCIAVDPAEEWTILLEDGPSRVCLLCSSDVDCTVMPVVDLVAILGHGVTLSPWQKLYFRTNGVSGVYVTFLLDCANFSNSEYTKNICS